MTATDDQLDALTEIVNIGIGQAAILLNQMVDSHIELEVPAVLIFDPEEHQEKLDDVGDGVLSCVQLTFCGSLSGTSMLVFPSESSVKLVSALTGEAPGTADLDAVMAGTLNEVGNIVINGVVGSISNMLEKHLDFSLPNYLEGKLKDLLKTNLPLVKATILLVRTNFRVQDLQIKGNIFLILEIESLNQLLSGLERFAN
jgi:chemotaxis protein CheC